MGTFPEGGHTYTFTINGQNLGSPANPANGTPGIVAWTPPLPGIYYISVKADDGLGNVVNSLAVRYFATGTAVTSPVEGTLVPVGSSVVLKADATVASGFIQQIQFFDNGTPIGTDTTYPYSLIYAVPGVSGSAHAITAQATDNNGNLLSVSSAINLQLITPIGGAPTVQITSPANGAAIAVPTGSNTIPVAVTANAANADGRITKVEVYLDGELFATDTTFPYSTTWAPTAVGTYRLTALAYDDKNNVPASSTNVISISAPPTVSITSPSSGNYVASGTVTTVTANAADADGSVTQVEFYANGAFIGVDTTAPFSVSWTPTFQTDDSGNPIPSSLTAIAKDNVGLSTISTAVSVNVTDGGGGGGAPIGLLPTTSVTTPTNGSTVAVNKATAVNAIASDPDGTITSVQFYANGVSLGSTTVFPYTSTWTPTAPGTYLLKSVATDNDGNQASSTEITVTVSGGEPPVVAISSPVAGATVNLGGTTTVTATATDADGTVASVQFFANGVSIGTDSASPYTASWTPTTPGIYTLTAVGTDNSGLQSSSTTVTVIVAGTAPSVSITGPSGTATVNTPQTITATATDSDGIVSGVQFFVNGVSIGTDLTYPYTMAWTPDALGTYTLTAVATDNSGLQTTSAGSTVTVTTGSAPSVSITYPGSGGAVPVNATTTITATATDADGTIANVQFFVNGVLLIADTSYPYSASWAPTAPGQYALQAVATDNAGNQTSHSITANVTSTAPTVSITAPAAGAVALGSAVTVTASASDSDGTVSSVQFFSNGVSLGTVLAAPYSVSWTPVNAGSVSLTAVVTDNSGLAVTSSTVSVTVGSRPTASVTSPADGAHLATGANTITATAADSDGTISSVDFRVDGVSVGTDTTSPYSTSWTATAGTHALTVIATDNSGLQTVSSAVSVTVIGTAPTVSITSPANASAVAVNSTATVTASASDTGGTIASVQFFANGVSLGTDTSYPYSASWTPTARGTYTLTAVATDNDGLQTTSSGISVTVDDNQSPTISAPLSALGATPGVGVSNTISVASATDSDGSIASVQFFANGVAIGTDTTAPYSVTWTPTIAGAYNLTAVATDNLSATTTSSVTAVTVTGGNAPTGVAVTAPSQLAVNSTATVTATATAVTGTIANVQFFANGTSLGTDTTFPYSVAWTPTATGTYSVSAIATDTAGNQTTAVATTTVTGTNASPTVSTPLSALGATPGVGVSNTISVASATDSDGSIASVQFFANGVAIGTDTTAPYSVTWTPTIAGTYDLTAVATDNLGATATSAVTSITVAGGNSPTVAITAPATGGSRAVNASTVITATATAVVGTVANVQFFDNGVLLGTDATFPYSVSWTPGSTGTHLLRALATDTQGNQAAATSTITVTAGTAPSISIVNPLSGANVTVGTAQIIAADVTPGSYAISGVQFYVNDSLIASSAAYPYGTVWTPTNLGSYSLTAVVTDAFGNRVTSAPVSVTVPSATTVVSVISNNGITAVPQGSTVILRAEPSPSQGVIKQVQFFDNGVAVGAPATDAPYTLIYRPSAAVGSTRVITAQATNANGVALAMSSGVSLTVTSAVTPLPAAAIGNPLDGAKIAIIAVPDSDNAIPVTVNTSLTSGFVTRVELYIEGALFGSTTTYPYGFSWKPSVTGTYRLVALVYDNHNNVVVSTVNANATTTTPAPTTVVIAAPPVVSITSPADSGTLTGGSQNQVALVASSSNGYPLDVQLFQDDRYVGGTSLGAGGVGTISYVPTRKTRLDGAGNIIVDPSSLYAIATDPLGFTTKSVVLTNLTVSTGGSSSGSTVIGLAPTVTLTAPTASSSFPVSSPVTVSANATDTDGNISSVTFMVNNQIVSSLTAYPYTIVWTPLNLGTYAVAAKVTDNDGNTVTSSPVTVTVVDPSPGVPTVSITRPAAGTSLTAGTTTSLTATASDDVAVASVQFYINGQPFDTLITKSPYNATWAPATPGVYTIVARVTDNIGKQATSTPVSVTVTPNAAPSVSLTSPAASTVVAGSTVALAATASDADGTVSSVSFLANNIVIATAAASPYTATWTAGSAGTYTLVAQATDNSGNVASSSTVTLTVVANQAPTVSITAPANGGVLNVGAARTLTATATDPDGTISSVQFLANGSAIATVTAAPFRTDWTPSNEGVYRLTAVATDNAGATRTSSEVTVLAAIVSAASSDTIYRGSYVGLGETGSFAAVNLHGRTATFIGYVEPYASGVAKTYYYADVPIDAGGGFTVRDAGNKVLITGTFGPTGVSGSLDAARLTFIGPVSFASTTTPVASGYYSGSLVGRYASILTGLVSPDGSITLYVKDGTFADSGAGTVDSTGAFTITTRAGNTIAGKADPATGFLSGSVSGGLSATFAAAGSSGNTFSDGFLRNISTRGAAGTANNVLIAGFVVNGTVPKQILVRAIGPSLGSGLTGLLADPQLQLYTSSGAAVSGGYNNDWNAGLASTFSAVGAFVLTPGSKDAAVLVTLAPGVYSAQVSGVGGTSGLALVELYDVDNQSAFSSQKMVNISTRGQVGTGNNILLAGFVVNGTSPKKVLVRGAGPALAAYIASGTLADPILRVVRVSDGATIRENDNWEVGNDPTLVRDAATKVGAFAFATGSKDAVILMTLPPGIYSAQLSGAASGTGIGLVEVYEVP